MEDSVPSDHPPAPRHLYIHVPFCRAKCDYCDFYSEAVGNAGEGAGKWPGLADRFVAALVAEWEMERRAHGVRRLRTVYLGGGTPSLLGPDRLETVLAAVSPYLTPAAEVSLEVNPEDVGPAFADWAADRSVRVSLGVQSFRADTRTALGRRAAADPWTAYQELRAAGAADVGVDLIYGAPGQTMAAVEADLAAVARAGPDHVSWYELEVAAGTPLARRLRAAEQPDPDMRAEMYRRIVSGLERQGLRWYEVSNFARPGRRCRHNMAVWRGEDYLGLGPGAVGTVAGVRRRDRPDVRAYVTALAAGTAPARHTETLTESERQRERLYLAARIGAAVPPAAVDAALDRSAVAPLADAGFVRVTGGTLRVTRKGRYVADEVCLRLFRASRVEGTA